MPKRKSANSSKGTTREHPGQASISQARHGDVEERKRKQQNDAPFAVERYGNRREKDFAGDARLAADREWPDGRHEEPQCERDAQEDEDAIAHRAAELGPAQWLEGKHALPFAAGRFGAAV